MARYFFHIDGKSPIKSRETEEARATPKANRCAPELRRPVGR